MEVGDPSVLSLIKSTVFGKPSNFALIVVDEIMAGAEVQELDPGLKAPPGFQNFQPNEKEKRAFNLKPGFF